MTGTGAGYETGYAAAKRQSETVELRGVSRHAGTGPETATRMNTAMFRGIPGHSLRWRILAVMLLVFAIAFGNLALYLYGTRDALRRGVMHFQAQVIAEGFTATSDPATLPSHYAGAELS